MYTDAGRRQSAGREARNSSGAFINGIHLRTADGGAGSGNLIRDNLFYHNHYDGILLDPGADRNRIFDNEVQTDPNAGIAVGGDNNLMVGNFVWNNKRNLADGGAGNKWLNNTCGTAACW